MRIKITKHRLIPNRCCKTCERRLEQLSMQHPKEYRLGQQQQQLDELMVMRMLDVRMVKVLGKQHERGLGQQELGQRRRERRNRMVMSKFLGCLREHLICSLMRMVCQWFLSEWTLVPNCMGFCKCLIVG